MSSTEETPSSDVVPNNETNSISTSTSDSSQLESLPSNETTSSNEVNQPMTGISKKRKADGKSSYYYLLNLDWVIMFLMCQNQGTSLRILFGRAQIS